MKKVADLLSDPEMLSKISSLIGSPQQESRPEPSLSMENSKSNLLLAMKPLLKESKQSKIDALVKALTVSAAVSKMKKGGNNIV